MSGAFDVAAAKSAGYSDAEIAQFMQQSGMASTAVAAPAAAPLAAPGSADDPSTGGGTLQIGPWDTGIHTPQVVDRTLAGAGRGMVHAGRSVGNLFGLVPDSDMRDEAAIDKPLMATTAGKVGNLIGESALTAPLGMGAGAAVGKLGAMGARAAANPLVNAMIQGGTQGLATSDPGSRGIDTALGAATGGLTTLGGKTLAKAMTGMKRTPDAQILLDHGVDLPPALMNPTGIMNQADQALEAIPVAKQMVHGAHENAEQGYRRAIIQQAAAPSAPPIKPSENISDMLQQAHDSYTPLYDQAKGFPVTPRIVNTQGPDIPLARAFTQASNTPGVTSSAQKTANAWLQDQLTQLRGRNLDSAHLIDLRSDIRSRARDFKLNTDAASVGVGGMYDKAANAVTNALRSQLPPDAMRALDTADSNYGVYKIVEDAVAKSKDNLAGLTPQKLSQSIYDATQNPKYARGAGGQLRDLAKAGTSVFQTVVPPNGSRVATLAAGAAALATHPMLAVPAGAAALASTATQTGRRLAQGVTAPQIKAQQLVQAMRSAIPANAQPAVNAAGQIGQRAMVGAAMPAVAGAAPNALAAALLMARQKKEEGGAPGQVQGSPQ